MAGGRLGEEAGISAELCHHSAFVEIEAQGSRAIYGLLRECAFRYDKGLSLCYLVFSFNMLDLLTLFQSLFMLAALTVETVFPQTKNPLILVPSVRCFQ